MPPLDPSSKATIESVRTFSTSSRPALRAAACGGRPRAGNDMTVTERPASPNAVGWGSAQGPRHFRPVSDGRPWTHRALASALVVRRSVRSSGSMDASVAVPLGLVSKSASFCPLAALPIG